MLGPDARALQLIAFLIGNECIVHRPQRLSALTQIRQDSNRFRRQIAPVAQLQTAADQIATSVLEVWGDPQHRLAIRHCIAETLQREERGGTVVQQVDVSRCEPQAGMSLPLDKVIEELAAKIR